MQIIRKGQANTLVFTLTENVTLTTPYFLFEITHQVDKTPIYFIATDTSSYTSWYNKFSVTEGTNNPANGQIVCTNAGQYNYRIWEQSSSSNLDPANASTLLETGIIRVDSATSNTVTTYQPTRPTAVIYNATQ